MAFDDALSVGDVIQYLRGHNRDLDDEVDHPAFIEGYEWAIHHVIELYLTYNDHFQCQCEGGPTVEPDAEAYRCAYCDDVVVELGDELEYHTDDMAESAASADLRRGDDFHPTTGDPVDKLEFCLSRIERDGFYDTIGWGTRVSDQVTLEELLGAAVHAERELKEYREDFYGE